MGPLAHCGLSGLLEASWQFSSAYVTGRWRDTKRTSLQGMVTFVPANQFAIMSNNMGYVN